VREAHNEKIRAFGAEREREALLRASVPYADELI
jgi:hypothetical protein